MSRIILSQERQIDPYQLISILNSKVKAQNQSLQWYRKMLQTSEHEKKMTINQLKKKKEILENLKNKFTYQKQQRRDYELELQQLRSKLNKFQRLNFNKSNVNLKPSLFFSSNPSNSNRKVIINNTRILQKPINSMLSLELKSSQVYNVFNPKPINRILEEKNRNIEEFIPSDVRLVERTHKPSFFGNTSANFLNTSGDFMNQTIHDEPISQNPAQFFIEDFLILGPDVSQLQKKRDQDRKVLQVQVKPAVLYAGNGKLPNQQIYTQIATRCYPFNAVAKRQMIESYQELKQIVQFTPHNKISNDCLVFNLKGQISLPAKNSRCLRHSNINEIQFIFCLRVPDFVWIAKDEKHYQRTEQQIWVVQKYYAIASYYPYFDIHLNILSRIHTISMKDKLQRILIEKQKFYSFDIRRNMLDLQRNQQVKGIIQYFKQHKMQFSQAIFHKNHYYGTTPNQIEAYNSIAKITAPIFMTNFSFEDMLLLLIGLFCEKTIILISKNQGIATLCALFLVNILQPFPYSYFIMLNADQQKLAPIVFQYPFPMIATIKKTQTNIHTILELFASARIEKKNIKEEAQRMILIDIDTNSIFYQGQNSFQPLIIMSHPGQQFMKQYFKVNPSSSKGFSFPKKMDQRRQNQQFNKKRQERIKIIQDIQHTIKNNLTKYPSFQYHPQIQKTLLMLIQYVRSFSLEGSVLSEAIGQIATSKYHSTVKKHLLLKHPSKSQLLDKVISSQFYADYLNLFAQH